MPGWFIVDECLITWKKPQNRHNNDIKCLGTHFRTLSYVTKTQTYHSDLEIKVQTAITLIIFTNNTSHLKRPKCWINDGNSCLCNRHSCCYYDTRKSMYCYCAMEYNNVSNYTLYYYRKMAYSNVYYMTSLIAKFEKTQSKTFLCFRTCTLHSHFTANFNPATHPSLA
jgi:hypothetical protein